VRADPGLAGSSLQANGLRREDPAGINLQSRYLELIRTAFSCRSQPELGADHGRPATLNGWES
jgi:hypothetical protein